MDFALPEHVEALRDEVRRFAHKEIRPHVMDWDESRTFPMEAMKKLGQMGMLGIIFPEQYGGAGMGYLEYAVVVEELSKVDGSIGLSVAAHNSLCSNHIYAQGDERQRERYLKPLASGQVLGAWALTEPGSGSDAGALRTTARKQGGAWVLNGTKNFATHGAVAGITVVMARTRSGHGADGISAFILERGMPGFRPGKQENKLGMRASDTSELILDEVEVPAENLLGEEGVGFRQAMSTLDGGRISIAALALGMAQGAFEASVKYTGIRRTFGKPINEHQAIQFKLAEMAIKVEAAHQMMVVAARKKDSGERNDLEAGMAKYLASEYAKEVVEDSFRIHGGYGFSKEYEIERLYREVPMLLIGEGTAEIQKMIIGRRLLEEYRIPR